MRLVIQRVSQAGVTVEENGQTEELGRITQGLLVMVGIAPNDTAADMDWLINKLLTLKLFEDAAGRLKQSVTDVQGALLVVSQFTLYGDVRKGTVPSWSQAAPPKAAEPLYAEFMRRLRAATALTVQEGRFQAHMMVQLVNDGPVTLIVNSPPKQL